MVSKEDNWRSVWLALRAIVPITKVGVLVWRNYQNVRKLTFLIAIASRQENLNPPTWKPHKSLVTVQGGGEFLHALEKHQDVNLQIGGVTRPKITSAVTNIYI